MTIKKEYPCIEFRVTDRLGSRLLSPITKSGVISLNSDPINNWRKRHSFHGSVVSLMRGTFSKCIDRSKTFSQKWFYPGNGKVIEIFGKQYPLIGYTNYCPLLASLCLRGSILWLRPGLMLIINKKCIKTVRLFNLLMSQRMKSIRAVANLL